MKITECRIVMQDWFESEYSKTGWDSYGWVFRDSGSNVEVNSWSIVEHIRTDKHYNPTLAIAEKETEIN